MVHQQSITHNQSGLYNLIMAKKAIFLKQLLERLYVRFNHPQFIPPDPLQFLYRYRDWHDQELVGLIASSLAYGRVGQIARSVQNVLDILGPNPYRAVLGLGPRQRQGLVGLRYRFTTGQDIADLLEVIAAALRDAGSLKTIFMANYRTDDPNVLPGLERFCQALLPSDASPGLKYLLPVPSAGSACKRLNMFLRWMVRKDRVDLGLWDQIDPAKLIVPIDTHMNRICRLLGLHDGKAVTSSSSIRLTATFAQICPEDPVRYDFALSRIGIVGGCTGIPGQWCNGCEIRQACLALTGSTLSDGGKIPKPQGPGKPKVRATGQGYGHD